MKKNKVTDKRTESSLHRIINLYDYKNDDDTEELFVTVRPTQLPSEGEASDALVTLKEAYTSFMKKLVSGVGHVELYDDLRTMKQLYFATDAIITNSQFSQTQLEDIIEDAGWKTKKGRVILENFHEVLADTHLRYQQTFYSFLRLKEECAEAYGKNEHEQFNIFMEKMNAKMNKDKKAKYTMTTHNHKGIIYADVFEKVYKAQQQEKKEWADLHDYVARKEYRNAA